MQIIQRRKIYYIISLIILVPSIISLMFQGLNLGIDFQGGTLLQVRVEAEETTSADVRAALHDLELGIEYNVQQSDNDFFIRTTELTQQDTEAIISGLDTALGGVELLETEMVGGIISSELARDAILALIIASVLMLLYITIRFELYFGIAAILAILHNVILVLGVFSIFQLEAGMPFIAAMLTVIGYSINDTIVVFDRIRENISMERREDTITMLNRSIMQTIVRSLNTVLTTSVVLFAVLLLGGVTLEIIAIAMLVGFIVGAYSSLFIATPLWHDLSNKFKTKRV
ncbi:Protein translocase subunit SecF [Candidatus Syntrophocurvum alkaliphilum]|uniref:Protein-export membrane protein SecF n=1 Tax=Candidatus Syntrophocurvum alkaliphilum TaxID=2293317 RepID=A0A6I6DFI6_9FIRM|nr:protein translocase subunit SecF [Candidatus Syntrophocurvum alkaliphilum]QGT99906.1 Protein translocase subunit SecF [Candidatus Syntrophocurvum alkaliphilum]